MPRRLHQELRAHGCVPVVAESMVLPGIEVYKTVPAHYAQP